MTNDQHLIVLRPVTAGDASRLYGWRNAEEVRRASLDPLPLVREAHERWLKKVLARSDRHLLIGEISNRPVGVLRFDVTKGAAEVSIYLAPGQSGKGKGTALLREGVNWARSTLPQVRRLSARIRPDNVASQRAFAKSGFKEVSRVYEISLMKPKPAPS